MAEQYGRSGSKKRELAERYGKKWLKKKNWQKGMAEMAQRKENWFGTSLESKVFFLLIIHSVFLSHMVFGLLGLVNIKFFQRRDFLNNFFFNKKMSLLQLPPC